MKRFNPARAAVFATALLGSPLILVAQIELLDEQATVLPEVIVSEKQPPRRVYEAKVEDFWAKARKEPTVNYVDVLMIAYDTSRFDLINVLRAKKVHRETLGKDRTFFCNYGAANIEVKINWRSTRADPFRAGARRRGEGTVEKGLGFDYTTREITLSPEAPFQALLHASGAALSGFPSKKTAADMKKLAGTAAAASVAEHVKFELELQDLNRYYATFTGAPIMTPTQALHALVLLGHKPPREVVLAIYARNSISVSAGAIEKALSMPKIKRDGRTGVFEHAYRLVDGVAAYGISDDPQFTDDGEARLANETEIKRYQVQDGLNQQSKAEYERMLENILIEAPGHI